MGHQINFFLEPNDQAELETRLRMVDGLVILHSRSPRPAPRVLQTINFTEDRWMLYLVRPADLDNVKLREVRAQGYWSVDDLTSPVVQVVRCYYDGKILRRGRLYYVDGFYDQQNRWIEKAAEFKTWAKRLFAAARKTLIYDKKLGAHVGPEAGQMRLRGEVEFRSL